MAAHLREIGKQECAESLCNRKAVVSLHNTFNALINHYCRRCGTRKLREFTRGEMDDVRRQNTTK